MNEKDKEEINRCCWRLRTDIKKDIIKIQGVSVFLFLFSLLFVCFEQSILLFLLLWSGTLLCFSTVLARGEFRGYYVLGSGLGFLLYCCTLGCVTVPLLRRIMTVSGRFFRWLLRPVFHGVVRICAPMRRKFGHFAKVFWKAGFFSRLPLQRDREMLYNKNRFLKRKAALQWQKKHRQKKASRAGSIGSSAGRQ